MLEEETVASGDEGIEMIMETDTRTKEPVETIKEPEEKVAEKELEKENEQKDEEVFKEMHRLEQQKLKKREEEERQEAQTPKM